MSSRSIDARDGSCVYCFSTDSLLLQMRVIPAAEGLTLSVACPRGLGASIDVLHGGETRHVQLDESGSVRGLPIEGPLLSLVLHPSHAPTVQTSWVRVD